MQNRHRDTFQTLSSIPHLYGRGEASRRAFGTSSVYNPLYLPVFSMSRHPTRALAPLTHSSPRHQKMTLEWIKGWVEDLVEGQSGESLVTNRLPRRQDVISFRLSQAWYAGVMELMRMNEGLAIYCDIESVRVYYPNPCPYIPLGHPRGHPKPV